MTLEERLTAIEERLARIEERLARLEDSVPAPVESTAKSLFTEDQWRQMEAPLTRPEAP